MTDLADMAAEIEARERADLLAYRAAARAAARWPTVGAEACRRCGDDIPAARRAAMPGTHLCTACAAEMEGGGVWTGI